MRGFLYLLLTIGFSASVSGCYLNNGEGTDPPLELADVSAVLAAASLGEDCPDTGTDGDIAGACLAGVPCPSLCQQSNMQITFTTGEGPGPIGLRIQAVTLHDVDGVFLEELMSREPKVWDEDAGYVEWDELLTTPSELRTTYNLNAPDWAALSDGIRDPWSSSYLLRVTVDLEDGRQLDLESEAVYRVAAIDT